MLNSETISDFANELHHLALDQGRATALAQHVAGLNEVVRAAAARMDSSDQPALFDRLLLDLSRPARS